MKFSAIFRQVYLKTRTLPFQTANTKVQRQCSWHCRFLTTGNSHHKINTDSAKMSVGKFAPCRIGDSVKDVDTPALVVCLDKLDINLKQMNDIMEKRYPSVCLRPHVKAHKSPDLARRQVTTGSVGICCQTLTEAEAMVEGGLTDVFISNQVIGRKKLRRFASLGRSATLSICVDDKDNIDDISEVAQEFKINIDLVVEVNVGQDRCGVEPGQPVAELAEYILKTPAVTFKGIQSYHGWNQHIRNTDDRRKAVDIVVEKTNDSLKCLKDRNIECKYITGGGTGTFWYECESGVFTEVQPGSYVFMDVDYNRNLDEAGKFAKDFQQSLFVLSTVQSVTKGERAVLDAGMKAVSLDSGEPLLENYESQLIYHSGGDEHGIVKPAGNLKVGELVWLVPGHCDPTVNLHDWLVGVRNGKVECIWPISARGPGV